MSDTNDLAVKDDGQIAQVSESARELQKEMLGDVGAAEMKIPVLHLFQGSNKEREQYGKHEPGVWVESLSLQEVSYGTAFIPVLGRAMRIVWHSRDHGEGEGMVEKYPKGTQVPPEYQNDQRYDVEDHFDLYCMVAGRSLPHVIRFRSTSLDAVKSLNTLERERYADKRPPGVYRLAEPRQRSNKKGNWYVPVLQPAGDPGAEALAKWERLARFLAANLDSMQIVDRDDQGDEVDARTQQPAEPAESTAAPKVDDEIPF